MKKIRFFLLIPIILFLLTGCVQDNTSKDNYTVKWLDYDGSILQEDLIVAAGEIPVYRQELPSREATKEFTFEFIGWDKKLEPVYEDQIYYAKYNQIIRKYEVKWLNYDEEIIKIETVNYGTVPSFNMPNPKKVETEKYTYKFIGWDKPLETVEENQVYQALYEEIIKTYSVKFIINGELISEQIIEHGSNANPPEHNELEGLTFVDWDKSYKNINSDRIINAIYSKSQHAIVWKNYDGEVLDVYEDVYYGDNIEYLGEIPERASTDKYYYEFIGWTPDVNVVTGNQEYIAKYKEHLNEYNVIFLDDNDEILKTEIVKYGFEASPPKAPELAGLTFIDWDKSYENITKDITIRPIYNTNLYELKLNTNTLINPKQLGLFRIKINDGNYELIEYNKINTIENLKYNDIVLIKYEDFDNKTLNHISDTNKFYFNGLISNENNIKGVRVNNTYEFEVVIKEDLLFEIDFITLTEIKVDTLYHSNNFGDVKLANSAFFEVNAVKYTNLYVLSGTTINLVKEASFTSNDNVEYVFEEYRNRDNDIITIENNLLLVDDNEKIIKAIYRTNNQEVIIRMTEQDENYLNQPVSFNGIIVNYDENNFKADKILRNPNELLLLKPGYNSITLITGRKHGLVSSPGLFLLSSVYSELPEGSIINGAITKAINGEELNRFNEINDKYVTIENENYTEIIFEVKADEQLEIKLSFVPVYAVNENGLVDENNNVNNEIKNIADFGTFSEVVNFEDSDLRNKVNMYSEFKQVADIKAEHEFGGLGKQAVFVRPASDYNIIPTNSTGIRYNALKPANSNNSSTNYDSYKIENANIFIPLHADGGDFALFGKEFGTVSNLVVENTTVVRGQEINSTINNPVLYNHYTFRESSSRLEYKLRIGGVASATHYLNNVTAIGLNVDFGLLTQLDENNNILKQEEVIAYVGGIAGVTGRLGVSSSSAIGQNIKDSLFKGEIKLTNVNAIVGGIAGLNISRINQSRSEVVITTTGYVGGVVGENRGIIEASSFAGSVKAYGVVGGLVGINNSLYFRSTSRNSQIKFSVLEGSVELLGENEASFPIRNLNNYEIEFNNYAGGFIGAGSVITFSSNYSNSTETNIKGKNIAPFIGLIDFTEFRGVDFVIRDNYFIGSANTLQNTEQQNIPVLGYWINHEGYTNSNLFANTIISVNADNVSFESIYASFGLNENSVLYSSAQLTDSLFNTFIQNSGEIINKFVYKPSYRITDQNKYNEMIGNQNRNYPFLSVGYKNYYEVKDEIHVSLGVYENNTISYKELDKFSDWKVTPISYDEYYGIYYVRHHQAPYLVFSVTKHTSIEINLERNESITTGYFFKDYHSFYPYSSIYDDTSLNYNRSDLVGKNNLVLEYDANSADHKGLRIVHEISLQVVKETHLSSDIYNYTEQSGFDVYEEQSFNYKRDYSYQDNLTLTSKNKGIVTTGVTINVEKLNSDNKNKISILSSTHSLDILDINNLIFNSVEGLEIVINKTINEFGFEVLTFDITSESIYRVTIKTSSAVRVSLTVTGVDESLTTSQVSDFIFRSLGLYNQITNLTEIIYDQNLNTTEMLIPLTTKNGNDLIGIQLDANTIYRDNGLNYVMIPEFVAVNGNKVFDNEFDFDQTTHYQMATHYVHKSLIQTLYFAEYLEDIKNHSVGFNVVLNFEYDVRGLRVERPDASNGTNTMDSVNRFIDFEFNLHANTNPSNIVRENIESHYHEFKAHKQGATLRLLNLEKLPNNEYVKYDSVTGETRRYTVADDIYKVVGQDRLVRVLLTASPKYRNYHYYVAEKGQNPSVGEHDFKFTTELSISVDSITSNMFYFGISIFEVYEVEIDSGMHKDSFGTLRDITHNDMPIAKLYSTLNESVEFKKINNTTTLNSFATLNNETRSDNKTFLLAEYGSRIKTTSSKDNVTDQIQLERLEFVFWNSINPEGAANGRLNESLLYSRPIDRNEVFTAEYKYKTVRVYIRKSMTFSTTNGRYEVMLPNIVPANPELANNLVLDSRMEGVYEVAEYIYNGKVIASSDPARLYGLSETPIKIPLDYENQGENLYDVHSRYGAIDITYGEEIEFVVKDYSTLGQPHLQDVKTGRYKLYTFLEEKGHEDYYTNIKESDPADTHINKLALLNNDSHWITNNPETGATIKIRGQVFGEFVIGSEFLPIRRNQISYNIGEFDGGAIIMQKHSIVRYSNPILHSSVVPTYTTLNNPLSFNAYKYSNIEIMFNLTAIAQENNITINSLGWHLTMNQNYSGDESPVLGLLAFRVNHTVGDDPTITRKQHMNFETSTEVINGDVYAVLKYNLSVHERLSINNSRFMWVHSLSEQMFTSLVINPTDSDSYN